VPEKYWLYFQFNKMNYQEYKPAAALAKYIDAYWSVSTAADCKPSIERIIPDTCADIIINLGSAVTANNEDETQLLPDKSYLVGTMTKFCDTRFTGGAKLIGIRFKPFALHTVLGIPLAGATNKTIELGRTEFAFKNIITSKKAADIQNTFDTFFIKKLATPDRIAWHFLESIYQTNGTISVQALAKKHFVTERQLERLCRLKAGITLKELCKQVRFRNIVKELKHQGKNISIDNMAFENGYYDHSHLAKEIKKYTGRTPAYYTS